MRKFTVLKEGKVHTRGTFNDEVLLLQDYPPPIFSIVLDQHLDFEVPTQSYADQRRMAYPPITEFADAVYWQQQGDESKMKDYMTKVKEVKRRFPKS